MLSLTGLLVDIGRLTTVSNSMQHNKHIREEMARFCEDPARKKIMTNSKDYCRTKRISIKKLEQSVDLKNLMG